MASNAYDRNTGTGTGGTTVSPVPIYAAQALLSGILVDPSFNVIRLNGKTTEGDAGGGLYAYRSSQPIASGKAQSSNLRWYERVTADLPYDTYRSNIILTPDSYTALNGGATPPDNFYLNTILSPGGTQALTSASNVKRTTALGSLQLQQPVQLDRVESMGNLSMAMSQRVERSTFLGSTAGQFFGIYNPTQAGHNFWANGTPSSTTAATAGIEALYPGISAQIATFNGYVTAATDISLASRTVGIGRDAFNLTVVGQNNVGVGYRAGSCMYSGSGMTIIGVDAHQNAVFTTDSVAIGYEAARDWVQTDRNVVIGRGAGYTVHRGQRNVIIGGYAFAGLGSGNGNVLLGYRAGNGITNTTITDALGATINAMDDALVITNDQLSTRAPLLSGNFTTNATLAQYVGIGVNMSPNDIRAALHVRTGVLASYATEAADADADEAILENNGKVGLTLRGGSASDVSIFFARTGVRRAGMLRYSHNADELHMDFSPDGTSTYETFRVGYNVSTSKMKLVLSNLPTASTGLVAGQVWRNGNVLNIV